MCETLAAWCEQVLQVLRKHGNIKQYKKITRKTKKLCSDLMLDHFRYFLKFEVIVDLSMEMFTSIIMLNYRKGALVHYFSNVAQVLEVTKPCRYSIVNKNMWMTALKLKYSPGL